MDHNGILVPALPEADRTVPWNGSDHAHTMKICNNFFIYNECGWSCLAGYQGERRVLHVHFRSDQERRSAVEGAGYMICGHDLRYMTEAEQPVRRRDRWYDPYDR